MIPKNKPSHPGVFIREFIFDEFKLNQKQLAEYFGVSRITINQLVNGKRKVTADIALRLGKYSNDIGIMGSFATYSYVNH